MRENLELSIRLANKLKTVFEYAVRKQTELVKVENISDELADVFLFNIETIESLIILLDELLECLEERHRFFGTEGIVRQYRVEELEALEDEDDEDDIERFRR
jgi:hypothetical protein